MKSFFKYYGFIGLAVLMVIVAQAQYDEKDFTLYSVKDGLSDNQITCLQQDDQGYIWVGTKSGLNRFDGTSFHKFYQGSMPINLPSGFITHVKLFKDHKLGIFTRSGFSVLQTNSYSVSPYSIPDTTAFSRPLNAAWDAVELNDGSFALTTAAGFYVLNKKGVSFRYDAFNIVDIPRKQVLFGREIFNIGNNSYLIYTNEDGQAIYNNTAKSFRPVGTEDSALLPFLHPRKFPGDRWIVKRQLKTGETIFISLATDSIIYYDHVRRKRVASPLPADFNKNLTWESQFEMLGDSIILLNSGITGFYQLKLDRKSGIIQTDQKKYLPGYRVKCMYVDNIGRVWAGTTQGVLKQEKNKPPLSSFQYNNETPRNGNDFFTSAYRHKSLLYAGHYSRHHGLSIIDPVSMKRLKQVQFYSDDSPWNEVLSIEMYHPDTLWIGTFTGILWYATNSGHYGKVFDKKKYPWAEDFSGILSPPRADGYAWMCALLSGMVVRYHIPSRSLTLFTSETNPALPFEKVKNIVYDSYGDVWISGHALARWNNKLQRFDTVINVYGGVNKFNDDILTISADNEGCLWLHNADNGVLQYKIREKKFVAYTIKDGLPSASLSALSDVIDHQLWVASNSHLSLMNTITKQFTIYDHNDGLPEGLLTARRLYFDSISRNLYLFAENNIARFSNEPTRKITTDGELLLEDVTVNNESSIFNPAGKIVLSHDQNNLTFHFTVIDFDRNGYQFAYRLNDAASWNFIGSQRNISFSNLSPGDYVVELKASGKTGASKIKSIVIHIEPPFWARGWFLTLLFLLIVAIVSWIFRTRMQSIRQKANIDRLLSQTEMKALQAQMNPHFIFNSLNSIREMILHDQNKEASHYLAKFAQLIRITLDQSTQEMISLRETIDYLTRYIQMEIIRNAFVTYQFNVADNIDLDETLVSPMIIQPFVENAIWHGVSANNKNINVTISFMKAEQFLVCTVDDNGLGIAHVQSLKSISGIQRTQHGISNVRERITLLNEKYNFKCGITIQDKKDMAGTSSQGTVVTIQLPFQTTDE